MHVHVYNVCMCVRELSQHQACEKYLLMPIEITGAARVEETNIPLLPMGKGQSIFRRLTLVGVTLAYHTNSLMNLLGLVWSTSPFGVLPSGLILALST